MPVTARLLACGLAALAVMLSAFTADARRPTTLIEQLGETGELQKIGRLYELVSAGAILYDRCKAEYDADGAKLAYNSTKFAEVSAAYMAGFRDAYQVRTGKLPADATIEKYRQYIANRQQQAKLAMMGTLDTRDCHHATVRRVDEFLEKQRQQALAQPRSL